jgi:tRNA A37 threonylcarbamoyladenosine synthetase subunit TsaC/SUA5/YrdC
MLSPIDIIIDNGKSKSQLSTTIVDCTTPVPKFLRIGEIPKEEILEFLSK